MNLLILQEAKTQICFELFRSSHGALAYLVSHSQFFRSSLMDLIFSDSNVGAGMWEREV